MCMYTWNVCACIHKEDMHVYMKMCTQERCGCMQEEYVHMCLCTWGIHVCVHEETLHVCVYMMNMFMYFMCRLGGQRKMLNVFLCHSWIHFFHIRPSAELKLRLKYSKPWPSYPHVLNPWCFRSVCCYWLFYFFIAFIGTEDLNWDL